VPWHTFSFWNLQYLEFFLFFKPMLLSLDEHVLFMVSAISNKFLEISRVRDIERVRCRYLILKCYFSCYFSDFMIFNVTSSYFNIILLWLMKSAWSKQKFWIFIFRSYRIFLFFIIKQTKLVSSLCKFLLINTRSVLLVFWIDI